VLQAWQWWRQGEEMSCRNIFIAAAALLVLCSCSTIVSPHYVGKPAPVFSADLVERAWYVGGHVWHVKPISKHEAIASTLSWHHGDELFEQTVIKLLATRLDEGMFLNIKQGENYAVYRLLPAFAVGCEFALIGINPKKVSQDIADGKIEGEPRVDWFDAFTLNVEKRDLDRYVKENLNTLFDVERLSIANPIPSRIRRFHDEETGC
jgi:hypothetical protein